MQDRLVEYVLDLVEVEERVQIDAVLAADEQSRRYVAWLRALIAPLAVLRDQEPHPLPEGLACRTCQTVRAARAS
jgi:anti-sigma-K factor RskA